MSTTQWETGIVWIRVGLLNDILRFDYALRIFFFSFSNLALRIKCWVYGYMGMGMGVPFYVWVYGYGYGCTIICLKFRLC